MKLIRKLESFTKEKYPFVIVWKTRNIRSLFNLKDKVSHVSSVVYEGHNDIGKKLETAKHLNQFPEHRLKRKILRRVSNKVRQRKIHEAYYVIFMCPFLNNQLEFTSLTLFQNGVT